MGSAKSSLCDTFEVEYKGTFAMPDTIRVSRWYLLREDHAVSEASGPHEETEIVTLIREGMTGAQIRPEGVEASFPWVSLDSEPLFAEELRGAFRASLVSGPDVDQGSSPVLDSRAETPWRTELAERMVGAATAVGRDAILREVLTDQALVEQMLIEIAQEGVAIETAPLAGKRPGGLRARRAATGGPSALRRKKETAIPTPRERNGRVPTPKTTSPSKSAAQGPWRTRRW